MQLTARDILVHFSHKYGGDWKEICEAISRKDEITIEDSLELKDYVKQLDTKQIHMTTLIDDDYPTVLQTAPEPPFVLFYKGNKQLIDANATKNLVSIWSTHNDLTEYESTAAIACTYDIYKAQGRCVTGASNRTDYLVQQASLELLIAGVVVLDCSFDKLNAKQAQLVTDVINGGGLVLTIYPDEPKSVIKTMDSKIHQDINLRTILGTGGSILVSGGSSQQKTNVNKIACWLSVVSSTVDAEEIYAVMHNFTLEYPDCCNFLLSDYSKYGVKPYVRYHLLLKERQQEAADRSKAAKLAKQEQK